MSAYCTFDFHRRTASYRDRLFQMVEDGLIDKDYLITACLKFMTNEDVKEMAYMNEIDLEEDDE